MWSDGCTGWNSISDWSQMIFWPQLQARPCITHSELQRQTREMGKGREKTNPNNWGKKKKKSFLSFCSPQSLAFVSPLQRLTMQGENAASPTPCASAPGCCSSRPRAFLGLGEKVSSSKILPKSPILHSSHTQRVLQKQWDFWVCGKRRIELAFVNCWWITLIWIFVCRGQTLLRSECNIMGKTSAIIIKKGREKHHWCKPWNK